MHNGGRRCAAFQYVLHSTSRPILTDAAAAMTLHCSKTLIAGYGAREGERSVLQKSVVRTKIIMKTHAVYINHSGQDFLDNFGQDFMVRSCTARRIPGTQINLYLDYRTKDIVPNHSTPLHCLCGDERDPILHLPDSLSLLASTYVV